MNDSLVCGIDVGSTNVKVLLMSSSTRTLWSSSIPVPRVDDGIGLVTDAAALVKTLERMMIEGWAAVGSRQPLGAIAVTGVGEDGIPVDAELRPLDFAIPWFDRRASGQALGLQEQAGNDARSGVPIDFSRTAAKWRWLRDHRPKVMQTACHWIALTDYPAVWWSRKPFISETLAARTGCYDVFARRWMEHHLDAAAAPPLPPVVPAGKILGTVAQGNLTARGVASGSTLVVAGGHDHPVAASAVRRLDPAALVDSLGTANLMYDEIAHIAPRSDPYVAFSVPALGRSGVACLGVFEFASSLEPFRRRDGGAMLRAVLAADRAPGPPGYTDEIVEALQRTLNPGLSVPANHGVPALRAVLEATCMYARRMRAAIRQAGSTSERLYAVGGWARSRALMELRASVLGEPLFTIDEEELTALGVAMIANDAICGPGAVPLRRDTQRVEPRADWQDTYQRIYPEVREQLQVMKAAAPA